MTLEERLLKAIFAKDDSENNGPEWEYDQITTLIIDSEYYIGGPEVEG